LVFVLIYACFSSLRNTLTIIFNIPIALVGSTTFLLISGFPLSVPALVGFIAVFGIAVQNGMVMVSYINKLRKEGMELEQAVITGASVRLRAELLSALIGSISLIPFIVSSGTGAEIEKPLAIVVVGGLVTRPIKIVILPMVYEWVERAAARRAERKAGGAALEQTEIYRLVESVRRHGRTVPMCVGLWLDSFARTSVPA